MNNDNSGENILPRINPKYIPADMDEQKFLNILRIDFLKQVRKEMPSYKKSDWQQSLRIGAKMFLLPKGFPVKLMTEPAEDIAKLRDYLFEVAKEMIENEITENQEAQEKTGRSKDVIRALRDHRKQIDDLGIEDDKARDYFGETPEDFITRTELKIR